MRKATDAITIGQSCDCLNRTSYVALFVLARIGSTMWVSSSFGSSTVSPNMLRSGITKNSSASISRSPCGPTTCTRAP